MNNYFYRLFFSRPPVLPWQRDAQSNVWNSVSCIWVHKIEAIGKNSFNILLEQDKEAEESHKKKKTTHQKRKRRNKGG